DRLHDLSQRMRRFAGDLLAARDVALSFRAPEAGEDRELGSEFRRQVFLAFKESVHNVARHSGCAHAEVELLVDGRELAFSIADVEDQREIREGLAVLLNGTGGCRCTGAYSSMEEALQRIGRGGAAVPDVVLLDIGLPGMSGLDGIAALKERHPKLLVVMLTV